MNISLTPAAEKFITRMVRFGNAGPKPGFRLTVTEGGCSGLAAEFTVEASPQEGDATFEWNGLTLFLPAASRMLLDGVTIDFSETPTSSGLSFFNPNAAACACSSSGGASATPGISTVNISSIRRA
jgi:iron-sulfur cluster assembly accessory protein